MDKAMKRLIADIQSGVVPFPYKQSFVSTPPADMFRKLRENGYISLEDGGKTFVISEKAYEEVDLLTDLFTEEARVKANIAERISPFDAWKNPQCIVEIVQAARGIARRESRDIRDPYVLREALYEKYPECTQFKCSLAKMVCQHYRAKQVLDPSSGWGDRAIGAAAAGVEKYVGLDPNPLLHEGYDNLKEMLNEESPTDLSFRKMRAEDYSEENMAEDFGTPPDLVFTSPPFHNYEVYGGGSGQSGSRFPVFEDWLHQWLFPFAKKMWDLLAPEGHLALYINDVRGTPRMVSRLLEFMVKIGAPKPTRIDCKRRKKRPIPLWVWTKPA